MNGTVCNKRVPVPAALPNQTCGVPSSPGPHGLLKLISLLFVVQPEPIVPELKSFPKLCVPVNALMITESPTHIVVLFAYTSIKQGPPRHCAWATLPNKMNDN